MLKVDLVTIFLHKFYKELYIFIHKI